MTQHDFGQSAVRVDQWLWAVRIYKTRSAAAAGIRGGHVKINGESCKPASQVVPGDRVQAWVNHRTIIYEVVQTPIKRLGAALAATCFVDHSPPPPPKEILLSMPMRDRGAGRPTKKERRELDRLRGRRSN